MLWLYLNSGGGYVSILFESQRIEIGLGIAFPLPGLVSRCNNDLWSPGLYGPQVDGPLFF